MGLFFIKMTLKMVSELMCHHISSTIKENVKSIMNVIYFYWAPLCERKP